MDVVDAATRSRMMKGIRSKDTKPEIMVRQYLHAQGLRFRLHSRKLPGSPDLVLPKYRVAIFVHGCFWHQHQGCRYATTPANNAERWKLKFDTNRERDARKEALLLAGGWRVMVVWECELRHAPEQRLRQLVNDITAAENASAISSPDVALGSHESPLIQ